jgi:hypothetical protein
MTEATTTKTEKAETKNGTRAEKPAGKSRFVKVATDRAMYKPEECEKATITGFLVGVQHFADSDNGPWSAFVIRATEPTKGCDFEGKVVTVNAGEELLLPRTAKLALLDKPASDATRMAEVQITPKAKVKIGGGRTMWTYDVAVNPELAPRKGLDLLGGNPMPRQLGAGTQDGDSEIPF